MEESARDGEGHEKNKFEVAEYRVCVNRTVVCLQILSMQTKIAEGNVKKRADVFGMGICLSGHGLE